MLLVFFCSWVTVSGWSVVMRMYMCDFRLYCHSAPVENPVVMQRLVAAVVLAESQPFLLRL